MSEGKLRRHQKKTFRNQQGKGGREGGRGGEGGIEGEGEGGRDILYKIHILDCIHDFIL